MIQCRREDEMKIEEFNALAPCDLLAGISLGTISILKKTPDQDFLILPNGPGPGADGLWQAVLMVFTKPVLSTRYLFETPEDATTAMRKVIAAGREIDLLGNKTRNNQEAVK